MIVILILIIVIGIFLSWKIGADGIADCVGVGNVDDCVDFVRILAVKAK